MASFTMLSDYECISTFLLQVKDYLANNSLTNTVLEVGCS